MDQAITLRITDHALIRYMERVLKLDMANIRTEISAKVATAVAAGADAVTVDGIIYKLGLTPDQCPAVLTLWPEDMEGKKKPPETRQPTHASKKMNRWRKDRRRKSR